MHPTFDGHNDFLLRLLRAPDRRREIWLEGTGEGHLDLPRMRKGGFAGGFFAIYVPSPQVGDLTSVTAAMDAPPYDLPLPAPVPVEAAQPVALAMAGHLRWMERAAPQDFMVCTAMDEIRACMATGRIAAIMHMEGAEAIGPDLDALALFHAMGLRSIGPVWSRPTAFGHGVPFRFPGGPDTGPGLTDAGRALVAACGEMGITRRPQPPQRGGL